MTLTTKTITVAYLLLIGSPSLQSGAVSISNIYDVCCDGLRGNEFSRPSSAESPLFCFERVISDCQGRVNKASVAPKGLVRPVHQSESANGIFIS